MELEIIQDGLNEIDISLTAMGNQTELFAAMLDFYLLTPESFEGLSERNKIGLWKYFLQSQGAKLIDGL